MEKQNNLARLLAMYVPFSAASGLGASLIYLYFKNAGMADADLIISFFFYFAAPMLVILAMNKKGMASRNLMWLGLAASSIGYALVALLPPVAGVLFLYSFLIGTSCFLFWVPFNIMYFGISQDRTASLSTLYYSVGPLLSIILPLIAATIAQNAGFGSLFLVTAALFPLPMIAAMMLTNGRHKHHLKSDLKELKGFKTLIFIEGMYGGGTFAAVWVISLFYFSSPIEMGVFLSFTTLFAVLASVVVSRLSDLSHRRFEYIQMFSPAFGLVTFLASLATNAMAWYGATAARNFFGSLFWPFTTTIIVDNRRDVGKSMVGREYILNAGRIVGVGTVLACSLFLDIYSSLVLLGLCMMAYPFVIEMKKRRIKVN